jgi:hypothetical protein
MTLQYNLDEDLYNHSAPADAETIVSWDHEGAGIGHGTQIFRLGLGAVIVTLLPGLSISKKGNGNKIKYLITCGSQAEGRLGYTACSGFACPRLEEACWPNA